MPAVSGRAISSEELERNCSRRFDAKKFASLCNAIVWASAGRRCPTLPSFTERVNAKDGGIDAEWTIEYADNDGGAFSALLGPGWNVYQYKQRDIFARGRDQTLSHLKSGLAGAIRDLHENTGRRPQRYVIFTNIDLTHLTNGDKGLLKERILEGYDQPESVQVEVVGAAELSVFLNDFPHLRGAFFEHTLFCDWEQAWQQHLRLTRSSTAVDLIGREKILEELRADLDNPVIRAIVIAGPPGIGKTRLTLETARHRFIESVVALDPESMTVSDLLGLEAPEAETVVIVEDPDFQKAESFIDQALARSGLKLFITFPTSETAPIPSLRLDERVRVVTLGPLSNNQSETLLQAAGANLDFSLMSWIVAQADGNPYILLSAARLGPDLRHRATTFAEAIASAFESQVKRELGDLALEALRLLSLLTQVGVRGRVASEIRLVFDAFGNSNQVNTVLNLIPRLERTGIVRLRGSFVEVTPPLFANILALSALRGRYSELQALFATLNAPARLRLVGRLQNVRSEETSQFWDELFRSNGPFQNLASALGYVGLLQSVARAAPERTVQLIETGLRQLSIEERLDITNTLRRTLIYTLDELLFHRRTSAAALRSLALLAEAENETYGNNSTGVFCECFASLHPQFPLSLPERIAILQQLLAAESPVQRKLVGIKAIRVGIHSRQPVTLRSSRGPEPHDIPQAITWGEVWNYLDGLVALVMPLARSTEQQVSLAVQTGLPDILAAYTLNARAESGIACLREIIEWVLVEQVPIPISSLMEALQRVLESLTRRQGLTDPETATKLQTAIDQVQNLIARLYSGGYNVRLKHWVSRWSREGYQKDADEDGRFVYKGEKEIRTLAQEAVEHPEHLSADLIAWLCSSEAEKANRLAWWLGRLDIEQRWLPVIETLGAQPQGAHLCAAYYGGWYSIDASSAQQRFGGLADAGQISIEAILLIYPYLQGDSITVNRLINLISEGRANPVVAAQVIKFSHYTETLSAGDYLRLARVLAGENLENGGITIEFLTIWLERGHPLDEPLAEFAWQCLESLPPISANLHYECDQLAARLAQIDLNRGFTLLQRLLLQPYSLQSWKPVDIYEQKAFWNALRNIDKERALRAVFDIAISEEGDYAYWRNDLHGFVEQEQDSELLIHLAQENELYAEVIGAALTTSKPGFWQIALPLVAMFPSNVRLRANLAHGVEQMNEFVRGPWSEHLERCLQEVRRVTIEPTTPIVVLPWLSELEQSVLARIGPIHQMEVDEDIDWF